MGLFWAKDFDGRKAGGTIVAARQMDRGPSSCRTNLEPELWFLIWPEGGLSLLCE